MSKGEGVIELQLKARHTIKVAWKYQCDSRRSGELPVMSEKRTGPSESNISRLAEVDSEESDWAKAQSTMTFVGGDTGWKKIVSRKIIRIPIIVDDDEYRSTDGFFDEGFPLLRRRTS